MWIKISSAFATVIWQLESTLCLVFRVAKMTTGSHGNVSAIAGQVWTHPVSFGLRTLFYAATPGETSYAALVEVPDYVQQVRIVAHSIVVISITQNVLLPLSQTILPLHRELFCGWVLRVVVAWTMHFHREKTFLAGWESNRKGPTLLNNKSLFSWGTKVVLTKLFV